MQVSEEIRHFIYNFYCHIRDNNVDEVKCDYQDRFSRLTQQYFKNSRWPSPEIVAPIVKKDAMFLILYREVYYRHLYAHVKDQTTLDDAIASYNNYRSFFSAILNAENPIPLNLPNQWLWDIIDEFIYQFINTRSASGEMRDYLRDNSSIWNIHEILNILNSIIEKSNITEQLRLYAVEGDISAVAGPFGQCNLYKMLGIFSLVGLCRVHCLLGDYFQAIKSLELIDLSKQSAYHDVPTCRITTNYFVGFAYMMRHNYEQAIKTFSSTILDISKVIGTSIQNPDLTEYISRKSDKMLSLLSVCITLHPMQIDRSVEQAMKEKFSDALIRLQRVNEDEFITMFQMGCPRFISPVISQEGLTNMDIQRQQVEMFRQEIIRQCDLLKLRSFLKLYRNLPVSKLVSLLAKTSQDELQVHEMLMEFKQSICSSDSDLNFYIDKETVHVADTTVERKFCEYFIKQIEQLESMNFGLDQFEARLSGELSNANPVVHEVGPRKRYGLDFDSLMQQNGEDETPEPITEEEIFEHIRDIRDPEHPVSLEALNVVSLSDIEIQSAKDKNYSLLLVKITPTIPHCSMSSLIGLCVKVKLLRSLPPHFKVKVMIKPGTHVEEGPINQQVNDKERVTAALENPSLCKLVHDCLLSCDEQDFQE
ncbi:Eukaryotic translation initiation factor 3 subunit L [Cichlidogyrus casuarinus]|uniref:Eukaryotic translation initiation factor 3 subunit L n=1 Tax=Cichlidogyrus casuarinus TaxID=1844966 RepID=A0ABD2QHK6_9PLAT